MSVADAQQPATRPALAPSELIIWKKEGLQFFPAHLKWLADGIQWGCVSKSACPWCGRPINPALKAVNADQWYGYHAWVGVPDYPPGGWVSQYGPWPSHGKACWGRGTGGTTAADSNPHRNPYSSPGPGDEWDAAYCKIRAMGEDPWAETGDGRLRLRTELLGEDNFQLSENARTSI